MTGTQRLVPACPALSRHCGTSALVPACPDCPELKQRIGNEYKSFISSHVPHDLDTGCTAYGGPDRRRERGFPLRGNPFPFGPRPDPAHLSRHRLSRPVARGDLPPVQLRQMPQSFDHRLQTAASGRVLPPGGLHRGNSHPVTAKSLKPQHIACWGSCCCPELDRLGDRLARTKCERKHHVR